MIVGAAVDVCLPHGLGSSSLTLGAREPARARDLRPPPLAAATLGVAWAVEFSQLWHATWLDAIRATKPGRLALGSGFDAWDLPAYAIGVSAAYGVDRAVVACRQDRARKRDENPRDEPSLKVRGGPGDTPEAGPVRAGGSFHRRPLLTRLGCEC